MKKYAILVILFILILPVTYNLLKTSLLISELMPGGPKLLSKSNQINHEKTVLDSGNRKVVVDSFSPPTSNKKSALIIATGVKIAFQDRPHLYKFAKIMSRLGYVVVWPRDSRLDRGQNYPESPETFITTFNYLKKRGDVNPKRISMLGFSTGSSLAFVAASDPRISKEVRSVLFFAGFYNAKDFITTLKLGSFDDQGRKIGWKPSHEVLYYTKENFKNTGKMDLVAAINNQNIRVDSLSPETLNYLEKISPSTYVNKIKAPVFIVHPYTDDRIPYVESKKLEKSLPNNIKKDFLLTKIFNHVRPKEHLAMGKVEEAKEVFNLFKFSYDLIAYL